MNIGIYSGSFNPIHVGHLILGNYITEFTDIDDVWYLVTPQNPLKEANLLDENLRFRMVELALEDYAHMHASQYEFSLPRPSFTVDTLKNLKKDYPQHTFSLIIGADNWELFSKWKDAEDILQNHTIYVYPRLHSSILPDNDPKHKIIVLNSPIVEVSSTFIREGLAENKNMQAFLPQKVYSYIRTHNLYRTE